MRPSKIHFHAHPAKPDAEAARRELSSLLPSLGLVECKSGRDADVIVALGGDGTILRAARIHPGVPVAGFNLGGLGYLACVEKKDFSAALSKIAAGNFAISRRTMLSARRSGGGGSAVALNDIVLMRELSGHAAVLDLEIDGHGTSRYFADGLVFATPTGSTAYSLSAGGPVLMPDSASFVVTPMNPHALGMRPVVTGDSVSMVATSRARDGGRDGRIGVYADGENAFFLEDGESVEISKAAEPALFVELEGCNPYDVLSRKLGWGGSGERSGK